MVDGTEVTGRLAAAGGAVVDVVEALGAGDAMAVDVLDADTGDVVVEVLGAESAAEARGTDALIAPVSGGASTAWAMPYVDKPAATASRTADGIATVLDMEHLGGGAPSALVAADLR